MVGPTNDPALKLKADWTIGGVKFHVEAYRVRRGEDEFQFIDSDDKDDEVAQMSRDLEDLEAVFTTENGFSTVKLDNDDYALFIFPHSA